jgi:hypothetical protein
MKAITSGLVVMIGAVVLMAASVQGRSSANLALYCAAYIFCQVPLSSAPPCAASPAPRHAQVANVILVTIFQSLISDLGAEFPDRVGYFSGVWGLFYLLGATLGRSQPRTPHARPRAQESPTRFCCGL